MDSTGCATLAALHKTAVARRGHVTIANPADNVVEGDYFGALTQPRSFQTAHTAIE